MAESGSSSTIEQRSIIKFLVRENVKSDQIYKKLKEEFKEQTLSKSSCDFWVAKYKAGWTHVDRPSREIADELSQPNEGYVTPHPPDVASTFERQFSHVDMRAEVCSGETKKTFDDLISYLTKDLTSDLEKARIIFMWISHQNFILKHEDIKDETTPDGFINLIAWNICTLAQLYTFLCRKAGLKCLTLRGYCKEIAPDKKKRKKTTETRTVHISHIEPSETNTTTRNSETNTTTRNSETNTTTRNSETNTTTRNSETNTTTRNIEETGNSLETEALKENTDTIEKDSKEIAPKKLFPKKQMANSDWATVFVEGQWRFVHLYMAFRKQTTSQKEDVLIEKTGTAMRDRDEKLCRNVDEKYFFPEPDQFIWMCRPVENQWQLVKGNTWTWQNFIKGQVPKIENPQKPLKERVLLSCHHCSNPCKSCSWKSVLNIFFCPCTIILECYNLCSKPSCSSNHSCVCEPCALPKDPCSCCGSCVCEPCALPKDPCSCCGSCVCEPCALPKDPCSCCGSCVCEPGALPKDPCSCCGSCVCEPCALPKDPCSCCGSCVCEPCTLQDLRSCCRSCVHELCESCCSCPHTVYTSQPSQAYCTDNCMSGLCIQRKVHSSDEKPSRPRPRPKSSSRACSCVSWPPKCFRKTIYIGDTESDYPLPSPPNSPKEVIIRDANFVDIDNNVKGVSFDDNYDSFFNDLFEDLQTDVQKLRALFRWYADNHDLEDIILEEGNGKFILTPGGKIKLRHTDHMSHPEYFTLLCRKAGFKCVLIRGRCKRADVYRVGQKTLNQKRVWNAVYLNNNWRLINTEEAFYIREIEERIEFDINGEKSTVIHINIRKELTEFFFLTDPDHLIHTCLPDDPQWQLLDTPITENVFFDEPWFFPAYILSSWRLNDSIRGRVTAPGGNCQIKFDHIDETDPNFQYKLFFKETMSGRQFTESLQIELYVTKETRQVLTLLPVEGFYLLVVNTSKGDKLYELLLECTDISDKQIEFPALPKIGYGLTEAAKEAGLTEASCEEGVVNVQPGEKTTFKFYFKGESSTDRGETKVERSIGRASAHHENYEANLRGYIPENAGNNVSMQVTTNATGDDVKVTVQVPEQSQLLALEINTRHSEDRSALTNVINYLLAPDTMFKGVDGSVAMKKELDELKRLAEAANKSENKRQRQQQIQQQTMSNSNITTTVTVMEENVTNSEVTDTVDENQTLIDRIQQECEVAEQFENLTDLQKVLAIAQTSHLAPQIRATPWYIKADRKMRVMALSPVNAKIYFASPTLDQIRGVLNHTHPREHVHNVMMATMYLLGENEADLMEWKRIKKILGSPDGVIDRFIDFDYAKVGELRAQRASQILARFSLKDTRGICPYAAFFYNWCLTTLSVKMPEVNMRHTDLSTTASTNT